MGKRDSKEKGKRKKRKEREEREEREEPERPVEPVEPVEPVAPVKPVAPVAPVAPEPEPLDLGPPEAGPAAYDPRRTREVVPPRRGVGMREVLTGALGFTLFLIIVLMVLLARDYDPALLPQPVEEKALQAYRDALAGRREVLHLALTPVVGLFGALAGFYFGERRS